MGHATPSHGELPCHEERDQKPRSPPQWLLPVPGPLSHLFNIGVFGTWIDVRHDSGL